MSGHVGTALQKAIFDKLTTALLTAGPGGTPVPVLDFVGQAQKPPYVVIGDGDRTEAWDTTTEVGGDHVVMLHVYCANDRSTSETKGLLKLCYDALHDQQASIPVVGHKLLHLLQEAEDVLKEPDGLTFHGVARYRALTSEA